MDIALPQSNFQPWVVIRNADIVRNRYQIRPGVLAQAVTGSRVADKPAICKADELHLVHVPNSDWHLALWRFTPSPLGRRRNHPLLLLSGVGTNAIGYDLAPDSSFARYMCNEGFDTWILEVRGAGLSVEHNLQQTKKPVNTNYYQTNRKSSMASQFFGLQGRFSTSIEDFQRQIDLVLKYNWDFDHYLEEDVPAAMEYIRTHCRPVMASCSPSATPWEESCYIQCSREMVTEERMLGLQQWLRWGRR